MYKTALVSMHRYATGKWEHMMNIGKKRVAKRHSFRFNITLNIRRSVLKYFDKTLIRQQVKKWITLRK